MLLDRALLIDELSLPPKVKAGDHDHAHDNRHDYGSSEGALFAALAI
jgi:hypothetical protein